MHQGRFQTSALRSEHIELDLDSSTLTPYSALIGLIFALAFVACGGASRGISGYRVLSCEGAAGTVPPRRRAGQRHGLQELDQSLCRPTCKSRSVDCKDWHKPVPASAGPVRVLEQAFLQRGASPRNVRRLDLRKDGHKFWASTIPETFPI